MQTTWDVVRIVAVVVAFAGGATKFWSKSQGFWLEYLKPWQARWLPSVFMVLGAVPAALQGATTLGNVWSGLTSEEFLKVVMAALALAFPGTHVNANKPVDASKAAAVLFFVLVALGPSGCAPMKESAAPPPGCPTHEDLAVMVADCRVRVAHDCELDAGGRPLESCPTLKECDEKFDRYGECK